MPECTNNSMEEILNKLLVADNATIQQGTKELREAFKNPDVISSLCGVIGTSQNPQIRQYAAVLLRKRLTKNKYWSKLPDNVRTSIKQGILQTLVNEPKKFVKNAIAQFIGIIVKHEFSGSGWPEILQFVQELVNSPQMSDRELGMYTMSVITDITPDQFLNHIDPMCNLFSSTLGSLDDVGSGLAYYTFLTMKNLIPVIEGNQQFVTLYQRFIPRAMESVQALAKKDAKHAGDLLEYFDDLMELVPEVIIPHIKTLVIMSLQIARTKDLDDELRMRALSFIGCIVRIKKKAIVKHKLIQPILEVLFQLMSVPPESEEQEEYFTSEAESNVLTRASETLDTMALHLPPEKLLMPLLQHIEAGIKGSDLFAKKAAFVAMAVVAEGCADCIRLKYLELLLKCICAGIKDQNHVVRNAALFALGQFSEQLQPEISQYASDLLPVLFEYLSQLCSTLQQNGKEPSGVDRMFYALEMFCENLGDALLPYLPTLMEHLLHAMNPSYSIHLRELAMSAIAASANAAKESMLPYFPRIIDSLKIYLTGGQNEETMALQTQALDTLGVFARILGREHFQPLVEESIQLGLNLMQNTNDPDIRKGAYSLFASIASIMKEDMSPVLPSIVEKMLESIQSCDGLMPHFSEGEDTTFPLYESLSESEAEEENAEFASEDDESDDGLTVYNVDNAYVEEKEQACMALSEIAQFATNSFMPFLQTSFDEVFKLLTYPQDDIKKAALEALCQFCINFSKIDSDEGRTALEKGLSHLIPKCSEFIHMDDDRNIVMAALCVFQQLLKEIKAPVLQGEGHRDAIINCIQDVLTYKTECQDKGDEEDANSEDSEAEQDEFLLECAGEIVPCLGHAMPQDLFAQYFEVIYPHFISKTKKTCTVAQRSFAMGAMSECFEALGPHTARFVPTLLPVYMRMCHDVHHEVRNNAVYGLGELVFHGKSALFPHYNEILQTLSAIVSKEKHAGTLDNICGTLARLIITNVDAVPMAQVFPVFMRYLPLREDFQENKAIFRCMHHLYQAGHPELKKHIAKILEVGLSVLNEERGDEETLTLVKNLVLMIQQDFPNEFTTVVGALPSEVVENMQKVFSKL